MAEKSVGVAAWIALFLGLYAFAAGVGELRSPNSWTTMLEEFERNPALRFLTRFAALALGGVAVIEGVLILAGLLGLHPL